MLYSFFFSFFLFFCKSCIAIYQYKATPVLLRFKCYVPIQKYLHSNAYSECALPSIAITTVLSDVILL